MGAPLGNEFWKLRSKHGRDKLFKTPELLWEAACEYFEWCEGSPINDPRSYEGKAFIQRPFTIQGFCIYVGANTDYLRNFKNDLPENDQDFAPIIRDIMDIIYNQKFEHAAVGIYSHNIIARDLGLAETTKNDHTSKGEPIQSLANFSYEQLERLANGNNPKPKKSSNTKPKAVRANKKGGKKRTGKA